MPEPRDHLPLTHLTYHVLLVLAEGSGHGYGIIQEVERRSGGLVSPGTGSFYEVMRKLRSDGLIDDAPAPEDEVDARRKYYRVSPLGAEVLRLEATRLEGLVRAARRLELRPRTARA